MVAIDYKKRQSLDQHGINRLKKRQSLDQHGRNRL